MRTLTDVHTTVRQVEVELSAQELGARLGYTGLSAMHITLENGVVNVQLYTNHYKQDLPDDEHTPSEALHT